MHHGGETENRGRRRKKESADNSPSPGKDESRIKKVLPSGKFRGLAPIPFFFFFFWNTFSVDWAVFLSPWYVLCVCVTDQSHGSLTGPCTCLLPKHFESIWEFPWWLTQKHALLKASRCQLVPGLLENSESFDILWDVALVLQQNCYIFHPHLWLLTVGLRI